MDAERLRTFLLNLPYVAETRQWGDNLVYWVGDKAIGGKMFALMNLDPPVEGRTPLILSYAVGPERFPDLLENEALYPAPYFARIHWIAAEHWHAFSNPEWEAQLRHAHDLTLSKLPLKVQNILTLPRTTQRTMIHDRKKQLAAKTTAALPKSKAAPAKSAKPTKTLKSKSR
jgi:predicted DNA-binding protein (MmcQ/YjbR family)